MIFFLKHKSIRKVVFFIYLPGIIVAYPAFGIDSGYIDAVKADVAEFAAHEFQAPVNSDWLGDSAGEAAQLMDLEGFSTFLKKNSPGSFIFYAKLPIEYKNRLHSDYLTTGDLDRVKQDIFKYTRQVKEKALEWDKNKRVEEM
jgi:hypothetical protein